MGLPDKPLKAIFPIISVSEERKLRYSFLGTGFFISPDGTFLTAKHVLEVPKVAESDAYSAVMLHGGDGSRYNISGVKFSQQFDIALGHVEGVEDIQSLTLANADAPLNLDIITTEFSGTAPKQLEDGLVALVFTPYFRKGYVICHYESDFPENIPTQSIDISFPALKGASGAPVIVEKTGAVVGMVVGNVEHELLPAQVERIERNGVTSEEIKYFLPVGKAISWKHLVDFAYSVRKNNDKH